MAEIVACLGSEDGVGADAGAVFSEAAVIQHALEKIEVCLHGER